MTPRVRVIAAALVLGLPLSMSACGSEEKESEHAGHGSASTPSVDATESHNGADVAFATMMIPHHAQALVMTDMVAGRTVSPEFQTLVTQIFEAQSPEIETMTGWLMEWGEEVPATSRDHASGHGTAEQDATSGHDMAGMMTEAEMTELEQASDADFEKTWLEMMVKHHEGAVDMAEDQVADGKFPEAVALARSIIEGQQAEIDTMQQMIDGS